MKGRLRRDAVAGIWTGSRGVRWPYFARIRELLADFVTWSTILVNTDRLGSDRSLRMLKLDVHKQGTPKKDQKCLTMLSL